MLALTILFAAAAVVCTAVIVVMHIKTTRLMKKLGDMIASAMDGSFSEKTYDESQISSLEAQLAQYLLRCASSEKNLTAEKNKIKQLISDISHQTRTPLSNIMLYVQLLSEQELNSEASQYVNALSVQSEKLNFLISSLVKTSRLETGVISVCAEKNSVEELIGAAVSQAEPKAEAKHIAVNVSVDDCTAVFDMKWTAEALYNIIDNAIKYTHDGGKIDINARQYELFCRIDVSDNGIGIAEEERSEIFSRFYRSADVKDYDGVGIGLFLSREIAASQGGYIKVASEKGTGSTFSLFLPVNRENERKTKDNEA